MNSKICLLVYGLPAVGKTSVAAKLLKRREFEFIPIDRFWANCYENPQYTKEESIVVFKKFINEVEEKMKSNKKILLEGVFASSNRLVKIEKTSKMYNYNNFRVLLKANKEVLKKRIKKRDKSKEISENDMERLMGKMNSEEMACVSINTASKSIVEATDIICKHLKYK